MKNNKVISKVISGTLLCSMVGYTLPVFAYTKDETVYSKLDNEGNNYNTIVSTHIENKENAEVSTPVNPPKVTSIKVETYGVDYGMPDTLTPFDYTSWLYKQYGVGQQ